MISYMLPVGIAAREPLRMVNFTFASSYPATGMPDPATRPEAFAGLLPRRVAAYGIDLICIGAIAVFSWFVFMVLTVLSFGLLGPLLWFGFGLIPLAYHTLLLSGRHSATLGMRCFDLEMRSWTGERPVFLQALAQTVLFYLTVGATCSLILLLALINRRKRTLHDVLAGTIVLRALAIPWGAPTNPWRV